MIVQCTRFSFTICTSVLVRLTGGSLMLALINCVTWCWAG